MTRKEEIEKLRKKRAILLLIAEENKKAVRVKLNEKVYVKKLGKHPLAKNY